MQRDSRPFTASQLAAKLLGKEHGEVKHIVESVQLAYRVAFAADKEMKTGRNDSLDKISRGLAAGRLQKLSK